MELILEVFTYIIGLGVTVMMPIIITILGLIFRKDFSVSFRAGLTVGMGFVGLKTITGLLLYTISPVNQGLVERLGFKLTAVDVGWSFGSSIAWGTEVVPFVFLAIIATNVVMVFLGWTRTMDIDIWNFWHPLFIASGLYVTTGSMLLAVVSAVINMAIIFKVADWTQRDCEEVLGLEGISLPHIQTSAWALVGYPLNWVLDQIPLIKDINWTTEGVQEKLGLFGEPMIMGLSIGLTLAWAAGFDFAQTVQTGVVIAGCLVLMPRMVSLLMDGLIVIAEAAQEFMESRFQGHKIYIGLDSSVAIGHPFVMAMGLLMIPVVMGLAFVLPGNITLPLADLSVLSFFMVYAIVPSKGNLFRGIVIGVVISIILLYVSSYAAPVMTQLAGQLKIAVPPGTMQITSLALGAQWYTWLVYAVLNWLGGGG